MQSQRPKAGAQSSLVPCDGARKHHLEALIERTMALLYLLPVVIFTL